MICKWAAEKKATAKTAIGGGFFGWATAGMKIGGGCRRNSGDEPQAYRIYPQVTLV